MQKLSGQACISVVIAAYNAEKTISLAIQSSLAMDQVGEVILVDDCSADRTVAIAHMASADDPRLKIIQLESNSGPAIARNRAIESATMPFIAILDSDDFFGPERFNTLLSDQDDWDFCADNILFVDDLKSADQYDKFETRTTRSCIIDFHTFVVGNISTRGQLRSELGFLKPVIRRSFLVENGIKYPEDCRLGEDFIFFTEALAKGARFRLKEACGYFALHRINSLSGAHTTADLQALDSAIHDLFGRLELSDENRLTLSQYKRSIEMRIEHREVLETRVEKGLVAGLGALARRPTVAIAIAQDRLNPIRMEIAPQRLLISEARFNALCQSAKWQVS